MRSLVTHALGPVLAAAALTAGAAVTVPAGAAVRPAGQAIPVTAYVVNTGTVRLSDTVTPIDTATNTAGPAITVGRGPDAVAITPNGKTAYVVSGKYPLP